MTDRLDNKFDAASGKAGIARLLDDLLGVGPDKPMGYLPLEAIRHLCHRQVPALRRRLERQGLKTQVFADPAGVYSGALYAWHEKSLQALLDSRRAVLAAAAWPASATDFVLRVDATLAPVKTPLFDLVADAFADKTNPHRTDVPARSAVSAGPVGPGGAA